MILTTTPAVDGFAVKDYIGLISGETIVAASIFRDLFASFVNFWGGRTRGYEKEMEKARQRTLDKLVQNARRVNADGIIGVRFDYEFLQVGARGGLLMVSVSGTAVRLVKVRAEPDDTAANLPDFLLRTD